MEKARRYLTRLANRIGSLVMEIIDLSNRKHTFVSLLESEICTVILTVCRIHIGVKGPAEN